MTGNDQATTGDRLGELMLNEHGLVFDPRSGDSFQLNASGLECLRRLRDGLPRELLAEAMSDHWGLDGLSARCDAGAFLAELEQLGWL